MSIAGVNQYAVIAKLGATGDHVSEIQQLLVALGHDVPITGVFDRKTEMAVRAFEEAESMRETGMVTAPLLEKLRERSVLPPEAYITEELPDRSKKVATPSAGWLALGALALLALGSMKTGGFGSA